MLDRIAKAQQPIGEPVAADHLDWASLQKRFLHLKATTGPRIWESIAGRELALDIDRVRERLGPLRDGDAIFGAPKMLGVYWELVTECEIGTRNLLIVGERGTGKEELAKVVARRLGKSLQTTNCSNLVREIADAQLFGVAGDQGIAGVSRQGSEGVVQRARGGVLFLDEVFDAELTILPKLLRLLQQRTFNRVGGPEERLEETVIVAASNLYPSRQALDVAVLNGKARGDLVDRFDAILEIPPLRERTCEMPFLANHVLERLWRDSTTGTRLAFRTLSAAAKETLLGYPFPWLGNLRQLGSFLRELVKLQPPDSGVELDIPLTVIEAWLPAAASPEPGLKPEANGLSAWDRSGLQRIREKQLLAALYEELRRQNLRPESATLSWVVQTCGQLLRARNVSQKLRNGVGKRAKDIWLALRGLAPS